jgi:hypothetical protein
MVERTNAEKLIEEIDRYLTAVDLFRALDCEPTWRLDVTPAVPGVEPAPALGRHAPSAH